MKAAPTTKSLASFRARSPLTNNKTKQYTLAISKNSMEKIAITTKSKQLGYWIIQKAF